MGKFWLVFSVASIACFASDVLPPSLRYLGYRAPLAMRIPPHHYAPLKQRIIEGRELFDALMTGNAPLVKNSETYFDTLVSLAWGIYDRAVEKDGGFYDGTIVILDPDGRIFSFLHTYAHRMWDNTTYESRYATTKCHGYPRHSTHFPEEKITQWGIDMRAPSGKGLEALLPTGKRHILFGKLSSGRTFLKFEEYGLCVRDGSIVAHGLGYVRSIVRKVTATNDGKYTRREDIPHWVSKLYRKFVHKAARHTVTIPKNPHSIHEMYRTAQLVQDVSCLKKRARKFIKELEEHFDHLHIRRGNEVIM